MLRPVHDRYLPPDHHAFVASEPPTGRVIVIAPTRAACETIEIAIGLHLETYLERTHGERVRELARSGKGFGIIAGTGTGKTLGIRPIVEEILQAPIKAGVVNREREATPELPNLNVIVVTTGIARRWFQDGDILPNDTLVVDEIHQTSAELELCLALGKRVGCRFIWLSATVDPTFYRNYLNSADVLEVYSFDPEKAADVQVVDVEPLTFLAGRFLGQVVRQKRGVGMFLPTRAGTEQAAHEVRCLFPRMNAAHYHGGESVSVIRPFLEEEGAAKPYFLAMTAAGQSALNVRGLDTVIIEDMRFTNMIVGGANVLTRVHLGNNEILQMAGRVHGRVASGRVFILSNRDINFFKLRPTAPEFQLAGDSERVALTCADLRVRADELELPVPLDRSAYKKAFMQLQQRGIINDKGALSQYGKAIEALPVERAWAELIVNADKDMVPYLAVMSSIESLHRMTREECDLDDLVVSGSDHLTTYNLYAEAYERAGYIDKIYGLPRQVFDPVAIEQWADERGVLVKSIEDAALAMASVLRSLDLPLPAQMPLADEGVLRRFTDLVAKVMPFDLVMDEQTADGEEARVSKSSVCGNWGAIAGNLRYFADRQGIPRASIEGTHIPLHLIKRYARRSPSSFDYSPHRKQAPLLLQWKIEYFGFELESGSEPVKKFPPELAAQARSTLAKALARSDAAHVAVHKNRDAIEEVREMHRRSGGTTPRLGHKELAAFYERKLEEQKVDSLQAFREAQLRLRADDFVPVALRKKLWALPGSVFIRDREVEINYDVEEVGTSSTDAATAPRLGVARLQLPEKLARSLTEEEIPCLDRPLRLVVTRGQRGALRASRLEELQAMLEGPWTPNERAIEEDNVPRNEASRSTRSEQRHRTPGDESQKSRGTAQGRRQSAAAGRLRHARSGSKTRRRRPN
jgi:ATP-dependent helicase HrpA